MLPQSTHEYQVTTNCRSSSRLKRDELKVFWKKLSQAEKNSAKFTIFTITATEGDSDLIKLLLED